MLDNSRNHCDLIRAGTPVIDRFNSHLVNPTECTKITRIPTPCGSPRGSPNAFSNWEFFSATDTSLGEESLQGCSMRTDNDASKEPKSSITDLKPLKPHQTWKFYNWWKREATNQEPSKDDELEITTGLKRFYDDKVIEKDFVDEMSEGSTLIDDTSDDTSEDQYANKRNSIRSAACSFINFSRPDIRNVSSSTVKNSPISKLEEKDPELELNTTFSFDSKADEELFHSVSLSTSTPKKKTKEILTKVLNTFKGTIKRKRSLADDLNQVTPINSYKEGMTSNLEMATPVRSLKQKLSARQLFPGYRFNDTQTSVLSGYLAESPQRDLSERYLGENGIENLDTDLFRLDNDPALDIFGGLTNEPVKRKRRHLRKLVKRRSFKELLSSVKIGDKDITQDNQAPKDRQDEADDEEWNPYLKYNNKRISHLSCGTTRDSISESSFEPRSNYLELQEYMADIGPGASAYRSLSNSRQHQDQSESLKKFIRKKADTGSFTSYRAPNVSLSQLHASSA